MPGRVPFDDIEGLRRVCSSLPEGDPDAAASAVARQAGLTKPPGSLGRLEALAAWLARWQERPLPRLDRVEILVFAGNHGVTAQGVSPYPQAVTMQMVANFAAGGAAINQIARVANASLRVIEMAGLAATADFSEAPAMSEAAFLAAVDTGFAAVAPDTDLLCLGEMGIGNTTAAAALAAGLFGGTGADWVGQGTGVDAAGLGRKTRAVDAALALH
ncbi:MAG: nicotinate-nucleotide--dimethylbenzimidazole phosphoribosyltransferase, partial [Janthinobacterium lividum]